MLYCAAVPLKPMGFKLALVRDICCKGWPRGCGDKGVFLEACVGDLGIRKSVLSMHYKYSREATETRVFAVEFGWVSLALGGGSGVCLSVSVSVSVSMCVFVSVPVCVCLCVCVCVTLRSLYPLPASHLHSLHVAPAFGAFELLSMFCCRQN